MFARLQQKWKVGPVQIVLIIICFALGGSLTGYSAKKIMDVLSVEKDWLWTIIYILLVIVIWPLAVLIVGLFFGQFKFFKGYVTRLGQKIGIVRDLRFEVSSPEPARNSDSEGGFPNRFPVPLTTHALTTHDQHCHLRLRCRFKRAKDH